MMGYRWTWGRVLDAVGVVIVVGLVVVVGVAMRKVRNVAGIILAGIVAHGTIESGVLGLGLTLVVVTLDVEEIMTGLVCGSSLELCTLWMEQTEVVKVHLRAHIHTHTHISTNIHT